jgi:hypothetical protein
MLEMNLMYRFNIDINHFIRKKIDTYLISDISIILIEAINNATRDYLNKR